MIYKWNYSNAQWWHIRHYEDYNEWVQMSCDQRFAASYEEWKYVAFPKEDEIKKRKQPIQLKMF